MSGPFPKTTERTTSHRVNTVQYSGSTTNDPSSTQTSGEWTKTEMGRKNTAITTHTHSHTVLVGDDAGKDNTC